MRRLFVIAVVATAFGCGSSASSTGDGSMPQIEQLRDRAEDNPNDPAAWRALAEGELLIEDGDHERFPSALARALQLNDADAALHLLAALDHGFRGRMTEAMRSHAEAVRAALRSRDPLAPYVAEHSLDEARFFRNEPGYEELWPPIFQQVLAEPGPLGAHARDIAASQLRGEALRDGDAERSRRIADEFGCVRSFRVAGPFVPFPLLAFDEQVPAQGAGALADEYDLGPGMGELPTREVDADKGCAVYLGGGPLSSAGTFIAEAFVEIDRTGAHALLVDTPNPFKVYVDGELLATVDSRVRDTARHHLLTTQLSSGRHELEVKVSTRAENPVLSLAVIADDGTVSNGAGLPAPSSPLGAYVRARIARSRGNAVEARESLRRFETDGATALTLSNLAVFALADPYIPSTEREDRARNLLRRAAERQPEALYPEYRLAQFERAGPEKLAALRAVSERFPQTMHVRLAYAAELVEQGSPEEALTHVEAVLEQHPGNCTALNRRVEALRNRMRLQDANALVPRQMECNDRSRARFNLLMRQRQYEAAATELERLTPLLSESRIRGMRLDLAQATGDDATVRRLRAEGASEHPFDAAIPLREADELLARGERARAIARIDRALSEHPRRMRQLRQTRRLLSPNDGWLPQYRQDGPEIIRRFEESGRSYEAGQVLVFDYMAHRFYADGSSTRLVHQIFRIQSEESIERMGQVSLPGRTLTLRSIKPDGRILEPDRISGLDSIPMPTLAIGDYVETEFLEEHAPRIDGSYLSGGWVFQNFNQPFDISKLVIIAPDDLPLVIEPRGPVPTVVETRDRGLRVRTWTVEESRPLTSEPHRAPRDEVLPFLHWGVNVEMESFFQSFRHALIDRAPLDPAMRRLVGRILRGQRDAPFEAKVRRLRDWVLEEIEGSRDFETMAPTMVAARRGSRTRVLQYLLRLAGIEAELAFAPVFGGREHSPLMAEELYESVLLYVRRPGGQPLFVWAEDEHAALDYLPPAVRGMEAVRLAAGLPRVQIPDAGPRVDAREVEVDIELDDDGSARVSVIERYDGMLGLVWRQRLEAVPEAELREQFESGYTARLFPGSELTSLSLEHKDDGERPFEIHYELETPAVGRSVGSDEIALPGYFPIMLAPNYASLPRRQTTELVPSVFHKLTLRVRAPGGSAQGPAETRLTGPFGARFTQSSRSADGTLTLTRELELPRMMVPPDQYPQLAQFCRAVDAAESQEIRASLD